MKKDFLAGILTASLLATTATFADNTDSAAIMSPNCTEGQIKEIAGDALLSIEKNKAWDNEVKAYIVSLDTGKMSYGELTTRMMKAKCFDKPGSAAAQPAQ